MNSFKGSIFSPFIDNVDYIPLQNYYFNFRQGMIENDTLCVNVTIIDDNIVEEDEELYVVLSSDSSSVRLKEPFRATIVIINNDCMSKFILIECLHLCTSPQIAECLSWIQHTTPPWLLGMHRYVHSWWKVCLEKLSISI